MIIMEKFLGQYETKTWKRLSRNQELVDGKNTFREDLIFIGIGKELLAINKNTNVLFKAKKSN